MWHFNQRWLPRMGALVLVALLAAGSALAWSETQAARSVAWCYGEDKWLAYSEGVPGSATEKSFSECLRAAAERGEIVALIGALRSRGALIQAGDGAVYWEFRVERETSLGITAYDDRVVFADNCDTAIELRDGALTTTAPGYPCGIQRIQRTDQRVTRPDFTLYLLGRQIIADGEDGWYHINLDRTGWGEDETARSHVNLTNRWPGVWIDTQRDHPGPAGGTIFFRRQPLAGNFVHLEYYRAFDWEERVRGSLIPSSFSRAGYDFLPDRDAYWKGMKDATDAIMDDLFAGRDDRPVLEVEARHRGLTHADSGRYFTTTANTFVLLHQIARVITGPNAGYGPTFTATLIMLWERYVPEFDREAALQFADLYSVIVGDHPPVNPASEFTGLVAKVLYRSPPPLPSDHEPIDPAELHLSVMLELAKTYDHWTEVIVVTSDLAPSCVVEESYSDGTTYQLRHGPGGRFTVNPGGTWNGLKLLGFSNVRTGEGGILVQGTPTLAGRVRVEVTTRCPGGYAQEPRVIGYSEIIVVDPNGE